MDAHDSQQVNTTERNASTYAMIENGKIAIVAVCALFGLAFTVMCMHIYIKCLRKNGRNRDASSPRSSRSELAREEMRQRRRRRHNRRVRRQHRFQEADGTTGVHLGLDKAIIELLPTFTFDTEAAFREDMECAVCLEAFEDGETGRLLPQCRHCFHVDCIDMWFTSHSNCPLCRSEVTPPADPNGKCPRPHHQHTDEMMLSMPLALESWASRPGFTYVQGTFPGYDPGDQVDNWNRSDARLPASVSAPANARAKEMGSNVASHGGEENRPAGSVISSSASLPEQQRSGSPRPVVILEFQPERNVYTSAMPLQCREDDNLSRESQRGVQTSRTTSYLAIEIIGEFQRANNPSQITEFLTKPALSPSLPSPIRSDPIRFQSSSHRFDPI